MEWIWEDRKLKLNTIPPKPKNKRIIKFTNQWEEYWEIDLVNSTIIISTTETILTETKEDLQEEETIETFNLQEEEDLIEDE